MTDRDALPALLHQIHMNQLAIGAAVEEVAIWIDQRGSGHVCQAVQSHLAILNESSDSIADAIATLMADG